LRKLSLERERSLACPTDKIFKQGLATGKGLKVVLLRLNDKCILNTAVTHRLALRNPLGQIMQLFSLPMDREQMGFASS